VEIQFTQARGKTVDKIDGAVGWEPRELLGVSGQHFFVLLK